MSSYVYLGMRFIMSKRERTVQELVEFARQSDLPPLVNVTSDGKKIVAVRMTAPSDEDPGRMRSWLESGILTYEDADKVIHAKCTG